MDMIVVGELGQREPFQPIILSMVDKQAEELFNLLAYALSLAIHLRMIGSGRGEFCAKGLPQCITEP